MAETHADVPVGNQDEGDFLPPSNGWIQRMLDGFTSILNASGTLIIVAVMLIINADVLSRSLLGKPVSGVPELVSMSIVAIVFLQIAHTLRSGGLTRAEVLIERLPRRLQAALETLYCGVGAGLCVVLFHGLLPIFLRAWSRNTYVGNIGDFSAPIWPVRLIMLIGVVALGLQFLLRTIRAARVAADTRKPALAPVHKSQGGRA